jgi:methylglyoxal/glyoxal reductase
MGANRRPRRPIPFIVLPGPEFHGRRRRRWSQHSDLHYGPMGATATLGLANGIEIPRLGFGVYRVGRGEPTRRAVGEALRVGYRHVDTAAAYGNERGVGEAVRESGLPRSAVFVTTKLWNDDQGFDAARRAFDASLQRLGFETVDLYLLHWPVPGKRLDSWRALEDLYREGRARAIGVSNFMVHHLDELLQHCEIPPAVNQLEISPFLQQREVRSYCAAQGIAVEAYSPLTKGQRLRHPAIVDVARRVGKSPAQVMLRWAWQNDLIVLPKSTRPERIAENAALDFELDPAAMAALDGLEEGLVTGWDPRAEP